jgi:periplasmic divalent cation tolerance protein
MPSSHPLLVLTTTGSREEAATIADLLVESRLAGCVQIVPGVESVYRWEGRVEHDAEWLLMCKTESERFAEIERAILRAHSYSTPEIVAIAIEDGSKAYLAWLRQAVS